MSKDIENRLHFLERGHVKLTEKVDRLETDSKNISASLLQLTVAVTTNTTTLKTVAIVTPIFLSVIIGVVRYLS